MFFSVMCCTHVTLCFFIYNNFPGDHSEEVTPVPIPNTEVKGLSGDGIVVTGRERVARCRVKICLGPEDLSSGLLLFSVSFSHVSD